MFYKKKGFPEVNDVLMCTVKRVLPHSVFVNIEEYGREGMVHISEVSPGRIRNIRDYVSENRKIVCKVLKINKEKGYIDLSLRRVNLSQKRKKTDDYKQEIKSEKLMENVGKSLKLNVEQMYKEVGYLIIDKYGSLSNGFQEIVNNDLKLESLGVKKTISKKLEEIIKDKIKTPFVSLNGVLKLSTKEKNGIEIIKKILNNLVDKGISVVYLSAPNYKLSVKDTDYKKAEAKLKDGINSTTELAKKFKAEIEFNRKNA